MIYLKFWPVIKCNCDWHMQSVVKRIGYFLKETVSLSQKGGTARYVIRYFLVDNNHTMYYAENYSQLASIIRTSKCLQEVFTKADLSLKKVRFTEMKVSEVKKYKQPEILSFLNQVFLEVSLAMTLETADNSTLTGLKGEDTKKFMFFTFNDHHLPSMHYFLANYEKFVSSQEAFEEEKEGLKWGEDEGKEIVKRQLAEKALEDKLASLSEQLSKLKDIEKTITECKNKSTTTGKRSEIVPDEKDCQDMGGEEGGSDSKEEFAVIGNSPNESPDQKGEALQNDKSDTMAPKIDLEGNTSDQKAGGLADGKGKEYFSDDLSYVGEYKGGKRHGTGYFVMANQGMSYVESMNGRISGI